MPLLRNPFTIRGRLAQCWLFALRSPVESVRPMLPAPLELITHGGFAFWNVVVCRIERIRPTWTPTSIGVDCSHVAYRLYARIPGGDGGLYFLRSDCDNRLIAVAGNLLTDFRFHMSRIRIQETDSQVGVVVESSDAPLRAIMDRITPPLLSPNSPFESLGEAASFLKYEPRGLSVESPERVNVVQIVRDEAAWKYRLLHVVSAEFRFFRAIPAELEVCYEVQPIDYQWNRTRPLRHGRGGTHDL